MEKEFLRPPEVARLLGVGRCRVYQMIRAGDIPATRVAGAIRIPREAWERWVSEKVGEAMSTLSAEAAGR